ncbi:MAG: hypothetical protein RBS84_03840, partial [Kiritimatiellia bacterium]|nr:hypothetical protein [Kiritimatiellia bacterium]
SRTISAQPNGQPAELRGDPSIGSNRQQDEKLFNKFFGKKKDYKWSFQASVPSWVSIAQQPQWAIC